MIFPGWFFEIPWFFQVLEAFSKFHDFSRSGKFFFILQVSMIFPEAGNPAYSLHSMSFLDCWDNRLLRSRLGFTCRVSGSCWPHPWMSAPDWSTLAWVKVGPLCYCIIWPNMHNYNQPTWTMVVISQSISGIDRCVIDLPRDPMVEAKSGNQEWIQPGHVVRQLLGGCQFTGFVMRKLGAYLSTCIPLWQVSVS